MPATGGAEAERRALGVNFFARGNGGRVGKAPLACPPHHNDDAFRHPHGERVAIRNGDDAASGEQIGRDCQAR